MKIRIETKYGNYEIEQFSDDQDIYEMMEVWKQMLMALGYHPKSIKNGFNEIADEESE